MYPTTERAFKRLMEKARSDEDKRNQLATMRLEDSSEAIPFALWFQQHDETKSEVDSKDPTNGNEPTLDAFPRKIPIVLNYRALEGVIVFVIFVKDLFPWKILLEYLNLDRPAHCYLVGRYIIDLQSSRLFSVTLCSIILGWRLWLERGNTKVQGIFIFMIQSKEVLGRQYELIKRNYSEGKAVRLNKLDLILRRLMCYPVRRGRQIVYRLRINRTGPYQEKLCGNLSFIALLVVSYFLMLTPLVTSMVLMETNLDRNYLQAYPSCSPSIEAKYKGGSVGAWAVSFATHKVVATLADCCANFILWTNLAFFNIFIYPIVFFMHMDVMFYWRDVRANMEALLNLLRREHMTNRYSRRRYLPLESTRTMKEKINRPVDDETGLVSLRKRRSSSWTSGEFAEASDSLNGGRGPSSLDEQVHEVQAQLLDFFEHVCETDPLMSDLLSVSIFIWTVGYLFSTYVHIAFQSFPNVWFFYAGIVVLSGVYFACGLPLMDLHTSTMRSYQTICSIMALDESPHKWRFTKVLDYYSKYHMNSYSWFRKYPVCHTTYVSAIGFVVSSNIIIQNMHSLRASRRAG